jgi:predicted nuclease of restriction endonuclease-like (RecB) superfamily
VTLLFVKRLIDETRLAVSQTINVGLTMLYWNIGKRINEEILDNNKLSPDLVFREPYVLYFLNLKDTYQEKDFEKAILKELEEFILELGKGFTFVEWQKRMIIDNEDFYTAHGHNLNFYVATQIFFVQRLPH